MGLQPGFHKEGIDKKDFYSGYHGTEGKKRLQMELKKLGYDVGDVDGILGKKTGEAVRQFQKDVGIAIDGIAGKDTLGALRVLDPLGLKKGGGVPKGDGRKYSWVKGGGRASGSPEKEPNYKWVNGGPRASGMPEIPQAKGAIPFPDNAKGTGARYVGRDKKVFPLIEINDKIPSMPEATTASPKSGRFQSPVRRQANEKPISPPNDLAAILERAKKANVPQISQRESSFARTVADFTRKEPKAFEKGDGLLGEMTGAFPLLRLLGNIEAGIKSPSVHTGKNFLFDLAQTFPLIKGGKALLPNKAKIDPKEIQAYEDAIGWILENGRDMGKAAKKIQKTSSRKYSNLFN